MYNLNDDIVALATLAGKSALNVVRLSGQSSGKFYQHLTKKKTNPKPNHITLHNLYDPSTKKILDQAMVVYYAAPKSFTGEDCLEIMTHGGLVIVNQLIEACIQLGAREAMPGEFSYRAFINNKIDLLQAESIAAIAETTSEIDTYYAINNLKGVLSQQIQKSYDIIQEIITIGEHELDFSDNEITFTKSSEYLSMLKKALNFINKMLRHSYVLEDNKTTHNVVIVGLPNVGKSSLFNVLIGKSKAIVTSEKGTTRDVLEQSVYINQHVINLIDTAGLRKTKNKIEKIGVQKSLKEIKKADIVLVVDDKNPDVIFQKIKKTINKKPTLLIQNKSDLISVKSKKNISFISCKNKKGIDSLTTKLSTLVNKNINVFTKQNSTAINRRQKKLLLAVQKGLRGVVLDYKANQDLTLCLSLLYLVSDKFNSLIRPVEKDEILNKIFGGFCVGK